MTGRSDSDALKFGGQWSLVKLDLLEQYLKQFTTALKNQSWVKLIYIDAFAGSGGFAFETDEAPLFDEQKSLVVHAGSAKRALETKPPFDELHFIERRRKNVANLGAMAASHSARATVHAGDANEELVELCRRIDWQKTRGVIFLDPFGNSVYWDTLEAIARTKLDIWYLFPLAGVYRNAPIDKDALTSEKRDAISRILGTTEWEQYFYEAPSFENTLFERREISSRRTLNVDGIEAFVTKRVRGVFAEVLPPRRLGPAGKPLFSLFFAMANRSSAARAVAIPIAQHILRQM